MNSVFLILFLLSFVASVLSGEAGMNAFTNTLAQASANAITVSIGLLGLVAAFLGLMNIAYTAGLIDKIGALLLPILKRIFPEIPENHPAYGAMSLNFSANILGLGNAATPFGLKAMAYLKTLAPNSDATRAMILFLAINTSSLTLIPTKVIALRSAAGSVMPASIVVPTIIATMLSTLVALTVGLRLYPSLVKVVWPVAKMVVGFACVIPLAWFLLKISAWILPGLIAALFVYAAYKKIAVYEVFVEGAAEAIPLVLKMAPYMVAMLVAIGLLRETGAFESIVWFIKPLASLVGMPAEVLPMAILRPLSGSGSLGYLSEMLQTYGADSTIGLMCSVIMGSTETTFYVLALYFGSVGIKNIKKALLPAISADVAGALGSVMVVQVMQQDYLNFAKALCAFIFLYTVVLFYTRKNNAC